MDSMPIVVGELPSGEAYEAGVRENWVLCKVGNDPSNMRSLDLGWMGWDGMGCGPGTPGILNSPLCTFFYPG